MTTWTVVYRVHIIRDGLEHGPVREDTYTSASAERSENEVGVRFKHKVARQSTFYPWTSVLRLETVEDEG